MTLKKSLTRDSFPKFSACWITLLTRPNCAGGNVVQAAHLIAAATGQSRIGRRRDAERAEVGRCHEHVVRDQVIAEPVAVVARGHRDAGPQLVLDFGREVPVVAARAVSEQGIVGIARGRRDAAEVLIGHRAALAVHAAVGEVAVRERSCRDAGRPPDRTSRSTSRLTELIEVWIGLLFWVIAMPVFATYRPSATLIAVRPLPKRS